MLKIGSKVTFYGAFFSFFPLIFPPYFPKYEIMPIKLMKLRETYQTCNMRGNQNYCCMSDLWNSPKSFKKRKIPILKISFQWRWKMKMTYFPNALIWKLGILNWFLVKLYLGTSKTIPFTSLPKIILGIFHPSLKIPQFPGTEPKHA